LSFFRTFPQWGIEISATLAPIDVKFSPLESDTTGPIPIAFRISKIFPEMPEKNQNAGHGQGFWSFFRTFWGMATPPFLQSLPHFNGEQWWPYRIFPQIFVIFRRRDHI
jgi:hypothetical protein